jgi:hypothetical protein
MSDEALMERCEAYLEGALSGAEARRFERELTLEENAAVFRQVLLMRQLLAELPPDAAPEDLVARIEAELIGAVADDTAKEKRERRMSRLSVALWGTSWALRGPAMALSGNATGGGRQALSGLGTVRYAAGPLAGRLAPERPRKPLWRRLLGM